MHQEKILQLEIHQIKLIIIRTSNLRILVYNFEGQIIMKTFVQFNSDSQIMTVLSLWDPNSAHIIIGTSEGRIWKLNLFDLCNYNKKNFRKKINQSSAQFYPRTLQKSKIDNISIYRFGKHWKILLIFNSGSFITIKSKDYTKHWSEYQFCKNAQNQ